MKKLLFSLIALLGIVACNETPEDAVSQTLKLTIDKSEIVADGTDVVTFNVADSKDAKVDDAKIYFADTNEVLEGNTFKTKYAGEYKFYAKRGNEKSNTVTVTATKAEETPDNPDTPVDPTDKQVVLSVSPTTIYADGEETAVFTLKVDGVSTTNFDVYNAVDNSKLSGNEFSTTEVGTYSFYAMCEEEKSNTVEVIARMKIIEEEEKPITLTASATTIKANGVESVKFTVMQDGADVTNASAIYVNNGKLNGNKFLTTTPGTYSVYAEKDSMRSETITITATEVTATGKSIVFAEGVTLSSGWYDVNKKSTPQNAQADAMMCWAASASNILQWFQDRYVADGNTLPAGCPNGTSSSYNYELQIMDVFRDDWDNHVKGNWADAAVVWYFEGRDINTSMGTVNRSYPKSGTGGYFKAVWSDISANLHQWENFSYANQINNYSWRGSSVSNPLLQFSRYIVDTFKYGMSSMAVAMSSNFSGGHAVTIWGYEIDNVTEYITKLYITDSDDGSTSVLREYEVKPDSGNAKIVLSGYATYYPFELYPISGYNSANR
ncbi:MAG: hypothetical protein J6V55_01170 [Alistipes sp.]|nr:hypothetical protein [Alistipes sp.]